MKKIKSLLIKIKTKIFKTANKIINLYNSNQLQQKQIVFDIKSELII